MNILVDGRIWSLYSAGVGTFFTGAILEWARQCVKDTFYIILPKGIDRKYELPEIPSNIVLLDYSGRFPKKLPNIVILQWLVTYLCRKLHISLYYSPVPHLPCFIPSKVKTMVTVHDVVNIEMAHTMSWTNRLATSVFFEKAMKKAHYIWANSYYTRAKVEAYFPERCCRDIFVGGAVDRHVFQQKILSKHDCEDIKKRFGIHNKFALFVGSLEPRKNLKFLLGIIPDLYREHGVQLVVVGGKSWKSTDIRTVIETPGFPKESTIFCGHVTNSELAMLYNIADCFVSAALMEGLGMPQLEALLCGCPIITANNSAMTEVAKDKDGAILIDGYQPEKWQAAILHIIEDKPAVNIRQLTEYDWEVVIRKLLIQFKKQEAL